MQEDIGRVSTAEMKNSYLLVVDHKDLLLRKELKFGFSEKATKFEKNLHRTFDKSVVFCARNSILVKKSTKILKKMWTSRIIQTLHKYKSHF